MESTPDKSDPDESTLVLARQQFRDHQLLIYRRTDRLFAALMIIQWLTGIAVAIWISPKSWEGSFSHIHPHVWMAILLGGLITAFPALLGLTRPGATSTRYVIAIGQMLMGGLLIHLTGGRIETHFHVFGSLAFLAFYRDWKVLIPATLVVAADHLLRGIFWPQSVYGVLTASSWRTVEHAGWVLFEVFFLTISCVYSQRDMWARALKHATLKAAEKGFRQLADAMPQIVWTSRSDGWIDYYNQRWFDYTGMTLEETQGWGWAPVLHPDDLQNCIDLWNESIRTGDQYEIEYRFKRVSDGAYRWHLGRASAVRDEEGRIIKWFGTCTDIDDQKRAEEALLRTREQLEERVQRRTAALATANAELTIEIQERKQMEAALRKSEESYRDLFDNAQDAIYVHDLKGTYLSVNGAAEALAGYTRDEIIGKNLADFIAPEHAERIRKNIAKKLEGKGLTAYEIELLAKDGRSVPVEVSTRLIYENGIAVSVQGIARDITERKRAEEALKASETRFQNAFDHAPTGLTLVSPVGRFLQVNKSFCAMVGYTEEELLASDFQSITQPDDLAASSEIVRQLLAGEFTTVQLEKRYVHKLGHEVCALTHLSLVADAQANPLYIIAQMQDITERKRAEAERQVIADIVHGVLTTSNLDELFTLAHQSISKLLPAENCFVALYDKTSEILKIPFCKDQFDAVAPPQKLGRGLTAFILRSGRPMLMTPEHIQELVSGGEIELVGTLPAAWLGVPLRTASEIIGVLVVQHYEDNDAYSQQDLELLASVADQLSLAIERKQIEIELKTNEMQLTEAQQIANLGSWEWDVQANKVSWSDELYRIYGLSPQEFDVTHEASLTCVHPDDRKLVESTIEQTLHDKVHPNLDYRIIRPDGTVRVLQANGRVTDDETGRTIKMVGTVMDITERVQVEDALRQSEEKYRELIENANDIIYTIDLSGRFTSFNGAGERLTGYTREEALRMNIADVIGPADAERVRERIAKNLASERQSNFELEIFAKDGSSVTMDISSRLILQDGVVVGIQGIGRDITERKQVDEKLRESEEKYRSLLENIPDVTWTTDEKGNTVFISANVASVYGFTSDELVSDDQQRWLGRIHPDDVAQVLEGYHSLFAERKPYDVEFRIQRKDGVWIWLHDRARMPYEKGGVLYSDGVFSDITERKRIDEELKTNEMQMSEAQRIAHLGSWEYDAAAGEVKWSQEEWRIFGLDQREFGPTFEGFLALVHPDDRHIVKRINDRPPQSGKDAEYDYRIVRPDGTVRVLRANNRFLCDELGQVVKITGTDQDITEQKQIEIELRQRDLQLVEAQHIALLGSWEWDIATNTTNWSAALYHIYGIQPQDCPPTFEGYLSLVHPDDCENVAALVETALQSGQDCSYDHRIIWPDRSVRFHHVNLRVTLDEAGRPTKLFGTAQDVTDRTQLDEELKEARDEAIESARLKSEFLANMSHEIRTPMNGVIGMTGLLLDTDLDEEQRDCAETIRTSGEALLTIINDILDFSKIEAGKLHFETLDFLLNNVVEDTIELLAERAHQKKIEFASLIYSDVPTGLRGDPGRLRQVLTNLIGNAIKFTERGEVIVRVEKESETNDHIVVRFVVSDTGIGISKTAQQRLFQALTQADGSTTRKYGGTGLGLAISKQLVELMGGEMGVTSTPGQGSTFWFTARFGKQPGSSVIRQPQLMSLEKLRVLIVDDNATNRKILSHQLGSWGMIHEEAVSGFQALELLRSAAAAGAAYDLAILDLMMPGMDGFEVARTIRSDPSIAGMHLVMLTSFGERGHGATAREAGVAAYLTKPVRQSQLFDCLANVISAAAITPERDVTSSQPGSELLTKHTLKEAKMTANKLILLAEDNIVNQKVAIRQLQKLGYRADAVANGREAIEALSRIHYDLVLMDCQMPEMDGYEATAEIRRLEGETGHTPIVAMTAHALTGDREKCIAAGMDEYITKPVKPEELRRVLELFCKTPSTDSADQPDPTTAPLVDVERMHEMMGDAPMEFEEIVNLYLDQMGQNLNKLDAAVASGNHVEVELIAHNCAGTSANCGMTAVAIPFRELEAVGRAGCLINAPAVLAQANRLFEQTRACITQHMGQAVS